MSVLRKLIVNPSIMMKRNKSGPVMCYPHMNELPIPWCPWQPWYNERQKAYSKMLVFGILWWCFSFGMLQYTGGVYLNWNLPDLPPRDGGPKPSPC